MTHPLDTADDAQLLSRIALGDRAAFSLLYQRSASRLLGVVLCIERNRAAAEDVLQEVYVKVWRSAASFDAQRAKPSTWLSSIARNAAIDALRRRNAMPTLLSTTLPDDEGDLLQNFVADGPDPSQQLESASEGQALRRCLGLLSADQSQAVALAFYQGLTYSEVADHLRQPMGTVKSWVRRGLQALKGCLESRPAAA